jgi:phenylalanyl-tRNA synthetase beta chain
LKRAALLIHELAGGELASELIDIYPDPKPKQQILLRYGYLEKISGKPYAPTVAKGILLALGFDVLQEDSNELLVAAPYHKSDIALPADLVEEIMRIDGFDQVAIPSSIRISPSVETDRDQFRWRQKVANYLVGLGFREILTNSITNSAYYQGEELAGAVKMINNLSAELNMLRPSMLETGLEALAFNINRKNANLRFFEFGKTYGLGEGGNYLEQNHLSLYLTGTLSEDSWRARGPKVDFYYLKGLCDKLLELMNLDTQRSLATGHPKLEAAYQARFSGKTLLEAGAVNRRLLAQFEIKQPVLYADFDWDGLLHGIAPNQLVFRELPRQQPVNRDLALVVSRTLPFVQVENTLRQIRLEKLQGVQLFDIFESDKIGAGKKSLALSFTFLDEEKTLTDKEIDAMMHKIMLALETELDAEIRK